MACYNDTRLKSRPVYIKHAMTSDVNRVEQVTKKKENVYSCSNCFWRPLNKTRHRFQVVFVPTPKAPKQVKKKDGGATIPGGKNQASCSNWKLKRPFVKKERKHFKKANQTRKEQKRQNPTQVPRPCMHAAHETSEKHPLYSSGNKRDLEKAKTP